MEFRNDIQGLRAIAVLSVFIFHLNPSWLPGGFIGVDVFFVISGFLISSICLKKLDKNQFSFISFYKSRIKRIVPAYYVLLPVIIIAGHYFYWGGDYYVLKISDFFSILFQSNNYFSTLDTYFGPENSENPFLHTWTLAVEMQFYFFLPFILFFVKRKWLPIVISIITILLFIYGTREVLNYNKGVIYYSLLVRAPEFLIGVLASLTYQKWSNLKHIKKNASTISIISLIILFGCFILINEDSVFPGFLASIPCLATAFLLSSPTNRIQRILSHKIFIFVGNLSYSLYLWHWPIMAYARYYYEIQTFNSSQIIVIILLSFILSLISYYAIEQPFRKLKNYLFWIGFLLLVILNALSYMFIRHESKITRTIPYFINEFDFKENIGFFGDTLSDNRPKIFLVGDSHASTMTHYFDLFGKKYHLPIKAIAKGAYPPLIGIKESECEYDYIYEDYRKLSELSEIEIENSDIVILSMLMNKFEFKTRIVDNLVKKIRPDQSLIVLANYPILGKHPLRHNRAFIKDHTKRNEYEEEYPVTQSILDIIKSHPNCYYLDLSKTKTFADIPFYNDTLMYSDKHHLNSFGQKVYFKNTGHEVMNFIDSIYKLQEKN